MMPMCKGRDRARVSWFEIKKLLPSIAHRGGLFAPMQQIKFPSWAAGVVD